MLSEIFDTTTDYLLKGIEQQRVEQQRIEQQKNVASISLADGLMVASAALIAAGLVASLCMWYESPSMLGVGIGMAIQIIGVAFLLTGCFASVKKAAWKAFLTADIWMLLFIPISLASNMLAGFKLNPYPYLIFKPFLIFLYIYVLIGGAVTALIMILQKR